MSQKISAERSVDTTEEDEGGPTSLTLAMRKCNSHEITVLGEEGEDKKSKIL